MIDKYFEIGARRSGKTSALNTGIAKELKLVRNDIASVFGVPPAFLRLEDAPNKSTLSTDVAKIEQAKRREYEKIEQVNAMYKAAKALGFPEQISELKNPYYVIVSIPSCFSSEDDVRVKFGPSPCSFIRLRLSGDPINIHDQFLSNDDHEAEIPNFVLWLLVCMKLFYRKDWDGRKWIDEEEAFKYDESSTTFSETSQVSNLTEEVVKQLVEQLARDIDSEIMRAIKKDPENWKVQVGNTIYGSGDKVSTVNLPSINIKGFEGGIE